MILDVTVHSSRPRVSFYGHAMGFRSRAPLLGRGPVLALARSRIPDPAAPGRETKREREGGKSYTVGFSGTGQAPE
eukprot:8492808-Pyramimonas_sp.AAC.1